MTQESPTISYDEFMPQPFQERQRLFGAASPEDRALLMKTHVERWLAANRHRLDREQVAVVEEFGRFIEPRLYQEGRDEEKIHKEIKTLEDRARAVFSREELRQIVSERADYVPAVQS